MKGELVFALLAAGNAFVTGLHVRDRDWAWVASGAFVTGLMLGMVAFR